MTGDPDRPTPPAADDAPAFAALAAAVEDRVGGRPLLVGIAGPVAVGKTTLVRALGDALARRGRGVQVLSTDAFLLPNAVLDARGLALRKGFPESYDVAAIVAALTALRTGAATRIPVYGHDVYDVVPGASDTVEPAEVILVEGVNALQAPAADLLDLAVYVDAPEATVREWFAQRVARLTAAAVGDAGSFYRRFTGLSPAQLREMAETTWDTINGPNLRDHIAPSAARADFVLRKSADHAVAELLRPARA